MSWTIKSPAASLLTPSLDLCTSLSSETNLFARITLRLARPLAFQDVERSVSLRLIGTPLALRIDGRAARAAEEARAAL